MESIVTHLGKCSPWWGRGSPASDPSRTRSERIGTQLRPVWTVFASLATPLGDHFRPILGRPNPHNRQFQVYYSVVVVGSSIPGSGSKYTGDHQGGPPPPIRIVTSKPEKSGKAGKSRQNRACTPFLGPAGSSGCVLGKNIFWKFFDPFSTQITLKKGSKTPVSEPYFGPKSPFWPILDPLNKDCHVKTIKVR